MCIRDRKKDEKPAASGSSSARSLWNESARCYLCIRLLLEVNAATPTLAVWSDDSLTAVQVDAMVRWLKDASRTAALGQEKPAARLLGVKLGRRSGYERTDAAAAMLKGLEDVRKNLKKKGR